MVGASNDFRKKIFLKKEKKLEKALVCSIEFSYVFLVFSGVFKLCFRFMYFRSVLC